MIKIHDRVANLMADLRMCPVDFEALYSGKNELTPLESIELFRKRKITRHNKTR